MALGSGVEVKVYRYRRVLSGRTEFVQWVFGFDGQDGIRAILFVALDLGWLSEYQAKTELPAGSVLTLWDREGVVLGHYPTPRDWLGRDMRDSPLFRHVVERARAGTAELADSDAVQRLYGFLPIRHTEDGVDAYVAAARGLVELGRGQVVIRDRAALEQLGAARPV